MLDDYYMAKARKEQAEFLDKVVLGHHPELLGIVNMPVEVQPKPKTPLRGQSSLIQYVEDDLCT